MYFVYILKCADGTLYTGITTDINRRIKQHQSGNGSKYVKTRRPVRLVYRENAMDRSTALKRELEIKAMSRPQKLALVERI
jgi:putative endonuclease